MKRNLIIAAILMTVSIEARATGAFECEETIRSDWLSKEELTSRLTDDGWSVRRMKEDGGCWEVYATQPDGKRVEAYFHPTTGIKLYVSQRGTVLFDIREQ